MRRALFALLLLAAPAALLADVRLPAILGDHMVVQAGLPVHLWGWADPGEPVTARFDGASAATTTGADGHWSLHLPPHAAGGPFKVEIAGRNKITLEDVLVGEVWVGSGQSNMQWTVQRSDDAEKEIAAADFPKIRIFQVKLETAPEPKEDVEGEWKICTPENIPEVSAVGYFFTRELHKKTGQPFGFIQSAWGGTPAEAWTTAETLDNDPELHRFLDDWDVVLERYPREMARYEAELAAWEKASANAKKAGAEPSPRPRAPRGPGHQHEPAGLYNAMIAPLTPYAIRGAIWYQGENNAGRPDGGARYERLFRAMIEDWRDKWSVGDFPFLFVQLANYARVAETTSWPELREAQTGTLGLAHTGMAVTIDIGNSQDIHPTNKQDVGHRLALAARAMTYGESDLVYSGPIYRQATHEPGKMRVWFEHVGGGLKADGKLAGFTIAGPDGVFHPAEAKIDGKTVVVSSADVTEPLAVRYGWSADPHEANLFNREGLPASPFRSDDWR